MREVAAAGGSVFLIPGEDSQDHAQLVGWCLSPTPGFISASARSYISMTEPWLDSPGIEDDDKI